MHSYAAISVIGSWVIVELTSIGIMEDGESSDSRKRRCGRLVGCGPIALCELREGEKRDAVPVLVLGAVLS